MTLSKTATQSKTIASFSDFVKLADYSLLNSLSPDPEAKEDGVDHRPREVRSGHFVPVKPSPIADPEYVSHSKRFFKELGLSEELVEDEAFCKFFSGDLSVAIPPTKKLGWATGYALSIYGSEYDSQCIFGTGNGYGDGRAMSVFEGVFGSQRWEMQLKGGGPTPYCRGADGRAVLRSSVREFLAQDYMHALGIPTSRSLTLFVSKTETVQRPWYSPGSRSGEPDVLVSNPVAISTRVAPSFLRVGQLELFARRARKKAHPQALDELQMIVRHLIDREYAGDIDQTLGMEEQVLELAKLYGRRLSALVVHWMRVGYCQGNFNSDNCAAGGFTLDYGPFGFCELFDPEFQPWTGGGRHFCFFNQPKAAQLNFQTLCSALEPLLSDRVNELEVVMKGFVSDMEEKLEAMWAKKLGLSSFDRELFSELLSLMVETRVDYSIFFRELSHLPEEISALKKSFYEPSSEAQDEKWAQWLAKWRDRLKGEGQKDLAAVSAQMLQTNPKYTWREWLLVPAYEKAAQGDYSLVKELQEVFSQPYDEQSKEIEAKFYRLKPKEYFNAGGVSIYSCSS